MPAALEVEIPPFFCPIDTIHHPDEAKVARQSGVWASDVGLVRDEAELARWHACTAADFYGGMVPDADTDRYQVATDWVYWGFYFDDGHCDVGGNATAPERIVSIAARLLRMLDSGDERLCVGNRYLIGLCDLARRYRALATPAQAERWVTAHRRWLFGVVQQISRRAAAIPPGLDEYLLTRLHEAGGPPTEAMFEFANDAEVPRQELDSPPVRAITELFWMIATFDNDLVSRYKEVLGQHDELNAVDVLARELDVTEREAIAELRRLRDRMMILFLRLREQLARRASAPLRIYLETLGRGIRSNIDWSLRTRRYAWVPPNDRFPEGTTIRLRSTCTDQPADADPAAPTLPSVAWWWTQLN